MAALASASARSHATPSEVVRGAHQLANADGCAANATLQQAWHLHVQHLSMQHISVKDTCC